MLKTYHHILLIFIHSIILWQEGYTAKGSAYTPSCDRIYFIHPSEKAFPYINLLNAIFVKTEFFKDGFPVYKQERGNAYFSYSIAEKLFYFSIGSDRFEEFTGLAVTPKSTAFSKNGNLKSLVEGTFFYQDSGVRQEYSDVKMRCLGSSTTECQRNDLIVKINNGIDRHSTLTFKSRDYENVFLNNRRVYYAHKSDLKLYYSYDSHWRIGYDIASKTSLMYSVKSNAIKPEFITGKWQSDTSQLLITPLQQWDVNISIECAGSAIIQCPSEPCQNSGTCHTNSLGKSFCTCQYGFKGKYCQRVARSQCKVPKHFFCGKQEEVWITNNEIGNIRTERCPPNSIQLYQSFICRRKSSSFADTTSKEENVDATWQVVGRGCRKPLSVGKNRFRRFSWFYEDPNKEKTIDDKSASIALKVLVILIPIFVLPILHCCIQSCVCSHSCPSVPRLISKHAYIGVFIWILYIIIYQHGDISKHGPETFKFIFIVACVFAALGYLFVLVESLCSSDGKYLDSPTDESEGDTYIRSLFAQAPIISIGMQCYHMETRTRRVRDRDGNYHTEHYQEEVTTWSGTEWFRFNYWKDISDSDGIPKTTPVNPIFRLRLSDRVSFANVETERAFNLQKDTFENNNKHRDEQYRCYVSKEIPGLKKHLMMYDKDQGLPFWLNKDLYCLGVLFCCSWPYRILLKKTTKKETFEICKSVSVTPFRQEPATPSLAGNTNGNAVILEPPSQSTTNSINAMTSMPTAPSLDDDERQGEQEEQHSTFKISSSSVLMEAPPPSYQEVMNQENNPSGSQDTRL